jgi:aminopeptidase N
MHRYLILPLLAAFLTVADGLAQRADSAVALPPEKHPRVSSVDIRHLALDLKLNWVRQQAYGTATITFRPHTSTDTLFLDAGFLQLQGIQLSSGKKLAYRYDGSDRDNALAIALGKTYSDRDELTVRIEYRTTWINATDPLNINGSFGKGLRFISPTPTEPRRRRQVWSVGDPIGNRYWFPGFDSPEDLRTTDISITVDAGLIAISNGTLAGTRQNADGTRTFHWTMGMPYANHNTSLVVGDYVPVRQSAEGIELWSYSYPDEVEGTRASVDRLPDMMSFFSEKTGYRYPYARYSQVFVQDFPALKGNAMAATITENMVDDDRTHADFLYLWDVTEGEALAHQWFGNLMTPRAWSEVWLAKAFALYFSGLYNEHKNGRDEFLLWQHAFNQSVYFGDRSAGYIQPIVNRHYATESAFTESNHPYFHGVNVLHMLRRQLGDEQWWAAIRQYVKAHAGKLVTTEDFIQSIEAATGKSIRWFFDQWLYGTGHPVFQVAKAYDPRSKTLTLTLRQVQVANPKHLYPQVPYFQGSLDIEVGERIETVWVKPQAENVYRLSCSREPSFVNVDFQRSWVKELNQDRSLEEWVGVCAGSRDVLAINEAVSELVNLGKSPDVSPADREVIKNTLRQLIRGQAYWRLRSAAISGLRSVWMAEVPNQPLKLNGPDEQLLLQSVARESAWTKAAAIATLGMTRDPRYAEVYLEALNDPSDRVISAAALALGNSRSDRAFDALVKLIDKPSWKNQSLMSALNGLKALGDPRGYEFAYRSLEDVTLARWTLSTPPVWDYRVVAAQTIKSLGRSADAFPLIYDRFQKALSENDAHVEFNYALLLATLGDVRGQVAFDKLREKYKVNDSYLAAVDLFEQQFKEAQP